MTDKTVTQQIMDFLLSLKEGELTSAKDLCELFDKDYKTNYAFKGSVYSCLSKACDEGILIKSKSRDRKGGYSWKRTIMSPEEILEYEVSPHAFTKAVFEYVKEQNKTIRILKAELKAKKNGFVNIEDEVLQQNRLLQEKLDLMRVENNSLKKRLEEINKAMSMKL